MNDSRHTENRRYKNLLTLFEERIKNIRFYSIFQWWFHSAFLTISIIAALIVPFGLAVLLYIPDNFRNQLNIFLLIISAIGLILGVVDHAEEIWAMSAKGMTQQQIADELGWKQPRINQYLQLEKICEKIWNIITTNVNSFYIRRK